MKGRLGRHGLAVLVLAATTAPAAAAEDLGSVHQFFQQELQRATQPRFDSPAPPRPAARTVPMFRHPTPHPAAERAPRGPEPRTTREARRPRPLRPAAAPATVVAVYGDRMAQSLAEGLVASQPQTVGIESDTDESAALTRADFGAWLQTIRDRLHAADRPSAGVFLVGTNDRRALPDGDKTVEPLSQRWDELYGARVDAFAAVFREAGVPLIWMGLPAVRDETASADFVRLNGIVRDRAAKDGITFVDTWEGFIDEDGRFSANGPDAEGDVVRLRKSDGVGFTHAGALKLANFLDADLKRLEAAPSAPPPPVDAAHIAIDVPPGFDAALGIDIGAEIRREAGLEPAAKPPAWDEERPSGPEAGPVMVLTAAPLAPGGKLAGREGGPGSGTAAAGPVRTGLLAQPGAEEPGRPRPGRADDFRWPRP